MGRPSNRAQRRAEIVDALMRVMAHRGYARATIAEIAREAELAPGLVHYHFDSKREILLALATHLGAIVRQRFAEAEQANLDAFVRAHVGLGEDADVRATRAWVVLGAEALGDPDVAEVYDGLLSERHTQLVSLLPDGPSRAQTATAISVAIEGAYRVGLASTAIAPGDAHAMVMRIAKGLTESNEGSQP